jgi:hypothetical protein
MLSFDETFVTVIKVTTFANVTMIVHNTTSVTTQAADYTRALEISNDFKSRQFGICVDRIVLSKGYTSVRIK